MQTPSEGRKIVFARDIDGRTERVEWIRYGNTVWTVADGQETVVGPEAWKQAWADLEARGFVKVFPADQRKRTADLECRLQTADVLFHLIYMAHGAASRFDALSSAQREAVREYLLLRLSDPNREFEHPMIEEALRGYWTVHTES